MIVLSIPAPRMVIAFIFAQWLVLHPCSYQNLTKKTAAFSAEIGHFDRLALWFYTPRFLAEAVLDSALTSVPSLLGRRFLDPACGSGIFLVGRCSLKVSCRRNLFRTSGSPRSDQSGATCIKYVPGASSCSIKDSPGVTSDPSEETKTFPAEP
jgi:hypothetical protein